MNGKRLGAQASMGRAQHGCRAVDPDNLRTSLPGDERGGRAGATADLLHPVSWPQLKASQQFSGQVAAARMDKLTPKIGFDIEITPHAPLRPVEIAADVRSGWRRAPHSASPASSQAP